MPFIVYVNIITMMEGRRYKFLLNLAIQCLRTCEGLLRLAKKRVGSVGFAEACLSPFPPMQSESDWFYAPAGTSFAILFLTNGLRTKKARMAAIMSNTQVM